MLDTFIHVFYTSSETILATSLLFGILYLLFSQLERFYPAERGQKRTAFIQNIAITSLFLFCGAIVSYPLLSYLPQTTINFEALSTIKQLTFILLYLFLYDLIFYWYHRAEHTVDFLWHIHVLHHSDTSLNVSSSYRTYWLEYPLQLLFITTPLILLFGTNPTVLIPIILTTTVWEFFTHTNIRLHLARLTPIFCGPQVHRVHHSILPEHQDKNFAQFFPFIDVIFGTYYEPSQNEYPPTGTSSLTTTPNLTTILTHPFKKWVTQETKK